MTSRTGTSAKMMSRSWYVRSKYSRVLWERFSVDVPSASGARVILSSSCTTEYTADCPSDSPRTIQTSIRKRRREGTSMFLSCYDNFRADCLEGGLVLGGDTGISDQPGKFIASHSGEGPAPHFG